MQWIITYTAYPAGPDLALVVEQEPILKRWRFSVKSDGGLLYRSAAEWEIAEGAQAAAEQWLDNPPQVRWPFEGSIEQVLDVRTWEEVPPPEPKDPDPT